MNQTFHQYTLSRSWTTVSVSDWFVVSVWPLRLYVPYEVSKVSEEGPLLRCLVLLLLEARPFLTRSLVVLVCEALIYLVVLGPFRKEFNPPLPSLHRHVAYWVTSA